MPPHLAGTTRFPCPSASHPHPQFLRACDANGTVGAPELRDLIVAQDNAGVLQVLRSYYNLPSDGASHEPAASASSVYRASAYIRLGGDEQAAGSAGL